MITVIVIPTYNERDNIVKLLDALMNEFRSIERNTSFLMQVLVVDDNSPDGTGKIVRGISKTNNKVSLITGKKQGIGKAYLRGFSYAINNIKADVVMEMDADFSHNPKDVVRLLKPIDSNNADFVIGSRYVPGGTIPADWGLLRKLNSLFGNIFARYVSGISSVHDCTAGFRAIRTSILKKISFENIKAEGYSFQMNLLYAVVKKNGKVKEIPVHFIDRTLGKSKIRLKDIREFIFNAITLRLIQIKSDFSSGFNNLSGLIQSFVINIFKGLKYR